MGLVSKDYQVSLRGPVFYLNIVNFLPRAFSSTIFKLAVYREEGKSLETKLQILYLYLEINRRG